MSKEKDYFKTFCDVSRAIGTAATKEQLLDLIVKSAIDTMKGNAACLFLADEKQDIFVPVAQKGLSKNYLHANPINAKKKMKRLIKEGFARYVDATSDERLENHEAKKAEGIVSLLTVPVIVQDAVVGILTLYTKTKRNFKEDEIQFLKALAEQGGIAIEKARLVERIYNNIALFLKLATAINSTLDVIKVLEYLTVEVSEALGMKGAVIRLLDEDSNKLKLVASHGLSKEFLDTGYVTKTKTLKLALEGETVKVPDISRDKQLDLPKEIFKKEKVRAFILTPIMAKDKVIGTLRLYSETPRKFSREIVDLVQALAHQGGLAIQNATMFLALQQDKKDLEDEIWSHRSWF